MTVLVTGATGLIGSHLVRELKESERVVTLQHNCPMGQFQKESLEGTVKVRGDIRDHKAVKRIMARNYVDRVYHLAALAEVKSAYKDPLSVYDVNVMGTVAILEASRQLEVEKVLVMTTDKVYGEKEGAKETSRLVASEPYATSKICQQYIAESYMYTYPKMNVVIPHSCNVFGYDPYASRIFPNVIRNCIRGKDPYIFIDDSSIREYIHVDDCVRALVKLMEGKGLKSKRQRYQGSYNVSTGWIRNPEEVINEILKHFPERRACYTNQKPHMLKAFSAKELPKQIQRQTMVSSKWKFTPELTWENAVEQTVADYFKYAPDWHKGGET